MDNATLTITATVIDPEQMKALCEFVQLEWQECVDMGMEKLEALARRVSWHMENVK